jgi:hypothetical protein
LPVLVRVFAGEPFVDLDAIRECLSR